MALIHITIERVIAERDSEVLQEILYKLDQLLSKEDDAMKQELMDKLNKLIVDVKSTVKP